MGLIAHYRLDGDATDAVGEMDGSASNVTWVTGKLGQAAQFQNIAACHIALSSDLGYKTQVSVCAWFKSLGTPGGGYHIITGGNGLEVSVPTSGALRIGVVTTTGRKVHNHGSGLIDGQWHHVALTFDGTTKIGYIDGFEVGRVTVDGTLVPTVPDRAIGVFGVGSTYRTNGLIDDVRIYDHTLSPREVRDLSLGLMSRYRLCGDTTDAAGTGLISIGSGTFVDSDIGIVADVVGARVNIPLEHAPLNLKGETIVFREKCDFLRSDALGGGFTNHIIQWGTYNGVNSGGFGLQSGNFSYYLKGPSSSGWTNSGTIAAASQRYDLGGWIEYAVVFGEDDTISLYMDGDRVSHFPLSVPYTGLNSEGVRFGSNMLAKVSDVRIYATALTPAQVKELYQQKASIDSEGSVHTPAIQQSPRARYIRDWTNGSTSNGGNHWLEVRAIYAGENISLGKPITASVSATRLSKITDGTTSNAGYATLNSSAPAWVQVDLEEVREIDEVQVWHYYSDGRTYYGTKTEISEDGINWTTIFDSAMSGTYKETSAGVSHQAKALGPIGATPRGLRVPDISEVGVTRGLVAWYPLIGDTKDYAGTNHATNNGAVATAEGYEFDGSDNVMEAGNVENLSDGVSFSFVVNATPNGKFAVILDQGESSGFTIAIDWRANRNNSLQWRDPGSGVNDKFPNFFSGFENALVWVALVHSQGTLRAYRNGELFGESSEVGVGSSSAALSIGGRLLTGQQQFNGIIRDVRIHNVALTPEEVALQANLALGGTNSAITSDCLYTKGQLKEVVA